MRASVTALAALALLGVCTSGAAAPEPGSTYLVRPDPRLCPSPRCGGVWVRRVNHATTVCADGRRHRECYAATVSGVPEKLWSARGGSVLVRGLLTDARIDGFPGLAALRAVAAWRPAGTGAPRGRTFRVRDNGVRCVAAPCFSLTATALEGGGTRTLSELDLARAGLSAGDLRRTERAVSGDGALVTGTVVTVPDAGPAGSGRSLRATQAWLRP